MKRNKPVHTKTYENFYSCRRPARSFSSFQEALRARLTGSEGSVRGYDTPMPREADFYTPGEAADLLGLTEFTVLGLLTSGQLEGHQDKEARWLIPAAAVNETVRRDRGADPLALWR